MTTTPQPPRPSLKARLAAPEILVAPGVYDGLTAALAEDAGFEAVYLSGAAVAYTRLGRPDIGLTTVSEVTDTLAMIRDRIALPIVVDADTGFGNALNAQRTIRTLERAGANALQVEDQTFPKRCGHLRDKTLIGATEMTGKIAAMADARASDETLIIARTDAIAVEGFEAALERGERYIDAGADALFVEAPRSRDQMAAIVESFGDRVPLMANMVEGGATPLAEAEDLQALGFSLVIFPGGIVRAVARTARDYYAGLKATGSNAAFADRMFDFGGLNALIGTDAILEQGERYAAGKSGGKPGGKSRT
ncbi:isocitrate lyase/phosphoenolpyruvate mutase family protein [Fodinicurvata sp. EGI_FJ10296]|uniref:isocitrate lyase/PEP mutase family protein n=1 Tax=Fodinicurvata sp. EGI_FJ10296 TaxID=3231908 RepID=UPI003454D941